MIGTENGGRAVPVVELEATVATTCVSLQLTTTPDLLPNHTSSLPRS
jgi:hypothetical protein